MNNQELAKLLSNLQKPAIIDSNGNVMAGMIGQTHDELGGPDIPESSRGFINNDGQYLQREQARQYLNKIAGHEAIKNGELSSELLRRHVPLYQSPNQKLYNFGNGHGISVLSNNRSAKIVFNPTRPFTSLQIDYSDLNHLPKQLTPNQVDGWLDDMDKESRTNLRDEEPQDATH